MPLQSSFDKSYVRCRWFLPSRIYNATKSSPSRKSLLNNWHTNKMLDAFEIVTTSGIVLWSRSNIDVNATVVNSLINDVFIEEKVRPATSQADQISSQRNPSYRHDKYTLKWTLVKDLGLIFVVLSKLSRRPQKWYLMSTGCLPIVTPSELGRSISWQHQHHLRQCLQRPVG